MLVLKLSMSMKMFTFTVNFPYFKSNFLGIIRENVCVIAEIPRICMRERNQNRLSILTGLTEISGLEKISKCDQHFSTLTADI